MGPLAAIGISSVDSLLTGMSDGGSERFDSFFARTIRENLFSDGNMTQGMDLIALIAPTTAEARRDKIIAEAQGFLYFISVRGVTGAQHLQAEQIAAQVQDIRAAASVPLAVGFGVRSEVQAREVAAIADAVVVGSRLIEIAEAEAEAANAPAAVGAFVRAMAEALR